MVHLAVVLLALHVVCAHGDRLNFLQGLKGPIHDDILFFEGFDEISGGEDLRSFTGSTRSTSLSPTLSLSNDDVDRATAVDREAEPAPLASLTHSRSLPITGLSHVQDVSGNITAYVGSWAFPKNILANKVARLTAEVLDEQRELLEEMTDEYRQIERIADQQKRALALTAFGARRSKKMTKKAAALRDRERLDNYYGDWGVGVLGAFHADENDTALRTGGSGHTVNAARVPNMIPRHYVAVTRSPPPTPSPTRSLRRRSIDELEEIFLDGLREVQHRGAKPTAVSSTPTSTIPKHRVVRELVVGFRYKSEQIGESVYTADKALYARDELEERDGFRRQLKSEGGRHVSHKEQDEGFRRQQTNDRLLRGRRDERRRERRSGRAQSEEERLPYDDFERNHKFCGDSELTLVPSLTAMANSMHLLGEGGVGSLGALFEKGGQTHLFRRSRVSGVLSDRLSKGVQATLRSGGSNAYQSDDNESPVQSTDPLESINTTHLASLVTGTDKCVGILFPFSRTDHHGFRLRRTRPVGLVRGTGFDGPANTSDTLLFFGGTDDASGAQAVTESQVVEEKFSHEFPFVIKFGPMACNGRFQLDLSLGRFVPYFYPLPESINEPSAYSEGERSIVADLRRRLYNNATLIDAIGTNSRDGSAASATGATMAWSAVSSARPFPIRIGSHPFTQSFAVRIVEEVVPPTSSLAHHPSGVVGSLPGRAATDSFLNMEWLPDGRLSAGHDAFALVEDSAILHDRAMRVAAALEADGTAPFAVVSSGLNEGCSWADGVADAAPAAPEEIPPTPQDSDTLHFERLAGVFTGKEGWLKTPTERAKAATTQLVGAASPVLDVGEWQEVIQHHKDAGTALKERHLALRHVVEVYVDGALVSDDVLEHEFPGMLNLNTKREFVQSLEEHPLSPPSSATYIGPLHSHFDLGGVVTTLAHLGFDVSQNRPGTSLDNVVVGTDLDTVLRLCHVESGAVADVPTTHSPFYAPPPTPPQNELPKSTREYRAAVHLKLEQESAIGDYLAEKPAQHRHHHGDHHRHG